MTKAWAAHRRNILSASSRRSARTEGFVEEMMNGQKVVKVFCHEAGAEKDFDADERRAVRRCGKSQPLRQYADAHS